MCYDKDTRRINIMEMGEIIKQLRLQKGITQEELGRVIGVQKSAIRKYESGMVENIKRSSIKKLADYFGVSPSFLLGYEDSSTLIYGSIVGDQNSNNVITVNEARGEIESELLSLCKKMTVQQKNKLLSFAYGLIENV